jgi:transposase-like protein
MNELPTSLVEAVRYYSDLDVCENKMARMKWDNGEPVCPDCQSGNCGRIASRRKWQCRECRKQFSVKVGTIFEDSPLGLDKWFVAVWSIANAKNGISSHELARALAITQKSAWFMLHRIREAMKTGSFRKMTGTIESDETFVGGEAKNMHAAKKAKKIRGRGPVGKTAVQGILERGGEVRTFVVGNTEAETLQGNVARNVEKGSNVYTDAAASYAGLGRRYTHATVDHIREYVRGEVHTNGLENFWSLFKRSIRGTWTHIAPFHTDRYAHEQSWRLNNRKTGDGIRFERLLANVVGHRLTYRQLCAIDDAGFMGIK